MDSAQLSDDGDCNGVDPEELSHFQEGVFGDPEILPRVGDEYQVEIPPLMHESDYVCPTYTEIMAGFSPKYVMVNEEVKQIEHGSTAFAGVLNDSCSKSIEPQRIINRVESSGAKVEPLDTALDDGTMSGKSAGMQQEMDNEVPKECEQLSDIREASFLLGLYVFGKNFTLVKRFIECKKLGDILSFYYSRFYGSDRYRKWKKKCKGRFYGQKLFMGLRQKELLSRLLPCASPACQSIILEEFKKFGEGNISLIEFVLTLKSMVGMNNLIEAVAIGKKKQDLTRMTKESLRSSQGFPVRPEIPSGKDCSALTADEIVKFLTGDFRLSKARTSDLFWEAVWPRLLARGWHSEQPMDRGYAAGSKHSLVFLMPGVKKFSRRKLVKGDHYFDSVSDVLGKVASDPELLELEVEADTGKAGNGGYGQTDNEKLDQNDVSDRPQHRYLRPRTPKHSSEPVKITVVDTSLGRGEKFKVREMRCLQVETLSIFPARSHSEEMDSDSSGEASEESDPANASCFSREEDNCSKPTMLDPGLSSNRKAAENCSSNPDFPMNGPDSTTVPIKFPMDQNSNMCDNMKPKKSRKRQLREMKKPEKSIYLAPVTKRRRRLTACSRMETSHRTNGFLTIPRVKKEEAHDCLDDLDAGGKILSQKNPSQQKLSFTNSSAKNSLIESREGVMNNGCLGAEHPHEEPQPRMLIDLNVPIPLDIENGETSMREVTEKRDQTSEYLDDPNSLVTSIGAASSEQQPNMNSRRQSTRNRPLTTKALEALANGYLSIKQRKRRAEAFPGENSNSRPSRRARAKVEVANNFSTDYVDLKIEGEGSKGVCSSNGSMFSEFQVQPEGEGAQISAL